jgi:zinc resistance-associated protein
MRMKRWVVGVAGLGALVAAGAYAQDRGFASDPFEPGRGPHRGARFSAEDKLAFTDARIAALHAGLKLNPEQEKLWAPVEEAIRGLVQQRRDARAAARERFASARQEGAGQDVPGALRFMADRQAASAEALRKLADSAQPLYASLDDAQKRRFAVLSAGLRGGMLRGPHHHGRHHEMRRD